VPTLAAVGILLNVSQHASGSLDVGLFEKATTKLRERRKLDVPAPDVLGRRAFEN
jgi:hypothetical protein